MAPSASRDRSRSPRRSSNREPAISKGLKWKSKAPTSDDKESRDKYRERDGKDRGDQRRPRESRKDSEREPDRSSKRHKDTETGNSRDDAAPRTKAADTASTPAAAAQDSTAPGLNTATKFGPSIASKFGAKAAAKHVPSASTSNTPTTTNSLSSTHQQSTSGTPAATGPMIIVTVNDRLGTKAQIPCLASDPIKLFKAMVAARIGRQPHEIMLKRQGERPFKDQLTLEDYGVCNGVQLDLELDTGD